MNNIEKLNKLGEYHQYLKGATTFDLTVLENIMNELLADIKAENDKNIISIIRLEKYIETLSIFKNE
jgi:hypothetical protein